MKFKSIDEFCAFVRVESLRARAERARAERRAAKARVLTPHRAALALDALERIKARKTAQSHKSVVEFVSIVKPVSKRAAKAGKGMTLKVRNWGIKDAHFN